MVNEKDVEAGMKVAEKDLEHIIETSVPPFLQHKAKEEIASHPELVKKVVEDVLDATHSDTSGTHSG